MGIGVIRRPISHISAVNYSMPNIIRLVNFAEISYVLTYIWYKASWKFENIKLGIWEIGVALYRFYLYY